MTDLLFRSIKRLFATGSLVLIVWAYTGPRVLAQAEAPPSLSLSTARSTYSVGDAIVLTVVASNESDAAWDYGPIGPGKGYFAFEVVGPEGSPAPVYPVQAGIGPPFVTSGLRVVPPGGKVVAKVLLSHHWDVLSPGGYVARVGYPEVQRVPVGNDGAYRLVVTGHAYAETAFTVSIPEGDAASAVTYASAVRDVMSSVASDEIEAALVALTVESAFAEGSAFYRIVHRGLAGATEYADDAGWQAATASLADSFLTQWPVSPYVQEVVRVLAAARARIHSPVEGEGRRVGVEALCGGTVFRAVNGGDRSETLSLSSLGVEPTTIEVPADSAMIFRFESDERTVIVGVDGALHAALTPNPSTCNDLVLATVVSPFATLTGAVLLAGEVEASFSGRAFAISGIPVSIDGIPDPEATAVHGVAGRDAATVAAVLDALAPNQQDRVTGQGPAPDVAVAEALLDLERWTDGLVAKAGVTFSPRPRGPVGTVEAPVVVYAPDGARLSGGFRGAGVLFVDGTLEMRGDAEWLGAVVVRGTDGEPAAVTLSGSPRIVGGMVVVPGVAGNASLDVRGRAAVHYSPEALGVAEAATQISR